MPVIRNTILLIAVLCIFLLVGCREDEMIIPTEYETINGLASPGTGITGLYLLNEGNMGSNKCTIDWLDLENGVYARNFYAERNPEVVKELGDVGNDIAIYGSKLYAVINCSHKVEVMDAHSGKRIGQVDIPNCRYVRFHRGKAYVSSYVGPVLVDPDAPKGAIYQVDTLSLAITGRATVGYQPEEMEIIGDSLYVANSGGYRAPHYDNTLSVVDLNSFRQVKQIPVGINLHRVRRDSEGKLWVSSRGNHLSEPSRLMVLTRNSKNGNMEVKDTIDVACSNMAIHGDRLYTISASRDETGNAPDISYAVIDTRSGKVIADNFITDGTQNRIATPYGLAVHPVTGDIYLTDAKNYVSSGTLYCFTPEGKMRWSVRTGDIPAAICFEGIANQIK